MPSSISTQSNTSAQLYILCTSDFFLESKTDIVCSIDKVGDALACATFINQYAFLYGSGIQSFRLERNQEMEGVVNIIALYNDYCCEPEEATLYLYPALSFL